MNELLKKALHTIRSLKLSMVNHPDCTPGSEFYDLTDEAQDTELLIEAFLQTEINNQQLKEVSNG
ncbi:hypothetical protein [Arachidicoccus terrestris]|uniref:hypothetical protein n=1 Tax=Arachidicoccus terrestris TaxID=2875539 RepID=UPI001CC35287|nr:hypothetical protein [Arachidicoccus terrestris]UAY56244.1 hypothetical protein K9M52_04290 [Arachidicoccus terrestris]